jgi:hypothetical protein
LTTTTYKKNLKITSYVIDKKERSTTAVTNNIPAKIAIENPSKDSSFVLSLIVGT